MPQLSIVVPTFNEAGNVAELRERVSAALPGIDWELIFVDDDSPDGTAERLADLAQQDRRVRCMLRIERRGLSSACLEGLLASSAPFVAVIDADLQHDETRLAVMLELLGDPGIDVVVGSRYAGSGSVEGWARSRASISRLATRLARLVLRAELKDPMSGFFMMRREVLLRCVRAGVSGVGFKILLDLFATSPTPLRFREVPYTFRNRHSGESKLDINVAWEYFIMLLDRLFGRAVPIRFIAFSLVGGIGLVAHLLVLGLLYRVGSVDFVIAQSVATLAAMSGNFVLNNLFTYRDMRLRGWGLLRGWVSFVAACGLGALANVGIAAYLFEHQTWWMASAVAGTLVGAVWNYAVTAVYTWRKPQVAKSGAKSGITRGQPGLIARWVQRGL
ncbi:MAG TPA: glycosyltransferase family 2 protein [Rubrivivax sp.]|jgi:dolichol-phosphate mannosyltransferase|nr:glycosyltransferase family 2 protein [Rubrivivax sp.]